MSALILSIAIVVPLAVLVALRLRRANRTLTTIFAEEAAITGQRRAAQHSKGGRHRLSA